MLRFGCFDLYLWVVGWIKFQSCCLLRGYGQDKETDFDQACQTASFEKAWQWQLWQESVLGSDQASHVREGQEDQ